MWTMALAVCLEISLATSRRISSEQLHYALRVCVFLRVRLFVWCEKEGGVPLNKTRGQYGMQPSYILQKFIAQQDELSYIYIDIMCIAPNW